MMVAHLRPAVIALALMVALSPVFVPSGSAAAEPDQPKPDRPELGKPGQEPPSYAPGEILVKFKHNASEQEKNDAHQRHGGRPQETIAGLNVQVVAVPAGREREHAETYRRDGKIEFAEVNGLYYALGTPNDPLVAQQWQYNNGGQNGGTLDADIDAFEAWDVTLGSASVPIAILDTGISSTHADLSGKVAKAKDFTKSGTKDVYGHGTHVAGSAAARTNNGTGVAGTCPECVLYNVKVLGNNGSGSWANIASGIVWAKDNGAKVISMSFGAYSPSSTVQLAINQAWSDGVVLAAAAGNDGQNWGFYPAAFDNVIAVAATTRTDARASFSNWGGNWVDVAAPGAQILSTVKSGGYQAWDGTSMATPHVAGVAGLVWSRGSCGSNDNGCVRSRIEQNADPIPGTGLGSSDRWAHGRLNACRAVNPGATAACPVKAF